MEPVSDDDVGVDATGRLSLLQFCGRQTGRPYAVPVLVHLVDGCPTVFTPGSWAINFRGGHLVTVVGQGRTRIAIGNLIEDGHQPSDADLSAVRKMIRLTPTQQRI